MVVSFITSFTGVLVLAGIAVAGLGSLVFVALIMPRRDDVESRDVVQRVFRNSAIPVFSQLIVRGVDFVVAIAILRLLGPEGNGQYALAVIIWLYVKTLSDFGLGVFGAREVARQPASAGAIIGETTIFRWMVLAVAMIPVAVYLGAKYALDPGSTPAVVATLLLMTSIVPASYAEAVNAAFNGLERMELAAWLNVAVSVIRAPLAVLLGATTLGVAGVALAALLTAALSAWAFHVSYRRLMNERVALRISRNRAIEIGRESWPLLVNALLISLFFRIDVFLIDAFRGATSLGIYDAAYKFINLLTIIPAYAVLAVFPLMSRHADDLPRLARAQAVTSYMLLTIGWIVVAMTMALSDFAILILAGDAYLPDAAALLRILVWFAPVSFLNGVFQYVLIARGEQRRIVPIFVLALTFNLATNSVLVPLYGTTAAACTTVATEAIILLAFLVQSRKREISILGGAMSRRLWRPTVVGLLAAAIGFALRDDTLLAMLAVGGTLAAAGYVLDVVGPEEREIVRRIIGRTGMSEGAASLSASGDAGPSQS